MEARAGAALAWLKWMYVFFSPALSPSLLPPAWLPWYHALDTDPRLEGGRVDVRVLKWAELLDGRRRRMRSWLQPFVTGEKLHYRDLKSDSIDMARIDLLFSVVSGPLPESPDSNLKLVQVNCLQELASLYSCKVGDDKKEHCWFILTCIILIALMF